MGVMDHHAIVVTGWERKYVAEAHSIATYLGCGPSDVTPAVINGYVSFFVPPDGSKEGWPPSDEGDERRNKLIQWLRDAALREVWLEWCSLVFGNDAERAEIDAHPWEDTQP